MNNLYFILIACRVSLMLAVILSTGSSTSDVKPNMSDFIDPLPSVECRHALPHCTCFCVSCSTVHVQQDFSGVGNIIQGSKSDAVAEAWVLMHVSQYVSLKLHTNTVIESGLRNHYIPANKSISSIALWSSLEDWVQTT